MALSDVELQAIHDLLARVGANDGVQPLSEGFVRGIVRPDHHLEMVWHHDQVVALRVFDGTSQELCVDPAFRRRGYGRAVLLPDVPVWAHGMLPGAVAFARAQGMELVRELKVMRKAIGESEVNLPEGYAMSSYRELAGAAPEALDARWLRVNNEAFSWHPEQGGWDSARLDYAREADWFNPDDVLFLHAAADPREIYGFHWLKLIPGQAAETYVIGLGDNARGRGLGAPLMSAGIAHAARKNFHEIELYVEADNAPALALYEKGGFEVYERHGMFAPIPQ